VKRNIDRFPNDFMFQLRAEEYKSLRFHISGISLKLFGDKPKPAFYSFRLSSMVKHRFDPFFTRFRDERAIMQLR
jgi:hypothetical protein